MCSYCKEILNFLACSITGRCGLLSPVMRPTRVLGLAGLSIAMLGASANAEIESEFSLGYADQYVFRGQKIGDDLYEFSFDFSGTGYCDFDWNAGIWYGMYENDSFVSDSFDRNEEEVDLYLGIAKDLAYGTVGFGAIRYLYPDVDDLDTLELYLNYSISFNAIDLGAAIFWTVDSQRDASVRSGDWYAELTAKYNFRLTETLTGEVGTGVAFFDIDPKYGDSGDGFANYSAHVALTQEISENISVTPYLSFTSNDKDYDRDESDRLNGGARVTFGF